MNGRAGLAPVFWKKCFFIGKHLCQITMPPRSREGAVVDGRRGEGPPRPTVLWSWCGRADVGIGPYEKDEAIAWGGDAQLCPAGGAVIWRGNMHFLPGRKRERTSRPFSFISCASAGAAHRGLTTYFPPFPQSPGNPPPGAPFRHPGWRCR